MRHRICDLQIAFIASSPVRFFLPLAEKIVGVLGQLIITSLLVARVVRPNDRKGVLVATPTSENQKARLPLLFNKFVSLDCRLNSSS